jgi:hypothetical protein
MQNTMGEKGYVSVYGISRDFPMLTNAQKGMFFMFGSFDILMGLFVYFFVPETKGLSLERMDELFGMTETAKQLGMEPETGPPVSIHENQNTKT